MRISRKPWRLLAEDEKLSGITMHWLLSFAMNQSDGAIRLRLEWLAGSLIALADSKAFYAVNTWINMVDHLTEI